MAESNRDREPEKPDLERMAELEASIRRLEAKLSQIGEQPGESDPPPVSGDHPIAHPAREGRAAEAEEAEEPSIGFDRQLAAAAVVCVVLLCALMLRRGADSALLAGPRAPAVGLAYCLSLLVFGGWLETRNRLMGRLLAFSAIVLSICIVLESYYLRKSISLSAAELTLGGIALSAAAWAAQRRAPSVAGVGVLPAAWLAAFASPHRLVYSRVGWGLLVGETIALLLAYHLEWTWLRWPLFVLAQLFTLTWALYVRAEGSASERVGGQVVGLAALSLPFLAASLVRTFRGTRRLDAIESAAPLAATALPLAWLAISAGTDAPFVFTGSALAVVLLAVGFARASFPTAHTAGGAFLVAGAAHAIWWWPKLPAPLVVTSLACSALGVALVLVAHLRGRFLRSPAAVGHFVQAALVGRLMLLGAIGSVPSHGELPVALASVIGVVGLGQYAFARTRGRAEGTRDEHEAILSVIAGSVAVFAAFRVFVWSALPGHAAAPFQMSQSVFACVLLACSLGASFWLRLSDLLEVTIVFVVLLAAKIVFYDTFTLPAASAIPPVLSLALLLTLGSWVYRARKTK